MDKRILFAGYGGQGILFAAKVAAYSGLVEDRHVSWMPSYGPEMRGGTANCGVNISDRPIGSPIVSSPNALVAMTGPAFDKFINSVEPGGRVYIDSSLVDRQNPRSDVEMISVPATKRASEENLEGLASVIMLGKLMADTAFAEKESVEEAIRKSVSKSRAHLLEPNYKALEIGAAY